MPSTSFVKGIEVLIGEAARRLMITTRTSRRLIGTSARTKRNDRLAPHYLCTLMAFLRLNYSSCSRPLSPVVRVSSAAILSRRCSPRDGAVVVLDDLSTGSAANLDAVRDHPQLHVFLDSVTNEDRLGRLADDADEIYHLAAVVGVRLVLEEPERTVATNLGPTEAVLRRLANDRNRCSSPAPARSTARTRRRRWQKTTTSFSGRRIADAGSTLAAKHWMSISPCPNTSDRGCRWSSAVFSTSSGRAGRALRHGVAALRRSGADRRSARGP